MAEENSQINEFIDELKSNPRLSGKLIKNLVKESSRLFLNFPVIGRARKIARELKKGSFSDFYVFERTLAHKLHPNLYKLNLNIFSNHWIAKHYLKKFKQYKNQVPSFLNKLKSSNLKSRLDLLYKLKSLIMTMVENDGHFMAVAFCDNVLKKIDQKTANFFRALEISLNFCKKALTDNKDENLKYIKDRYQKFFDIFKDEGRAIFLERISWDDKLKEYRDLLDPDEANIGINSKNAAALEKDELSDDLQEKLDEALQKEGQIDPDDIKKKEHADNDEEQLFGQEKKEKNEDDDRIAKYAAMIRDKYLNKINETDVDKFEKVINSINNNNQKKVGKEATIQLLRRLLDCWLKDHLISEVKKNILKDLLLNKFKIAPLEESIDKDFKITEKGEDDLQKVDSLSNGEENAGENEFSIKEKSEEELEGFTAEQDQPARDGEFKIKAADQAENKAGLKIAAEELEEEGKGLEKKGAEEEKIFNGIVITEDEIANQADSFTIKADDEKDDTAAAIIKDDNLKAEAGTFEINDAAKENEGSNPLKIKETESEEAGKLAIKDKAADELGEFPIKDQASENEGSSEVSKEPEEEQDDELTLLLRSKEAALENLEKYYSKIVEEANQSVKKLLESAENDNLGVMAIRMLNGDIYNEQRGLILAALEEAEGEDSLFLKIIRHLENGPFPWMSLEEKKQLLDLFIKKYQDNKKLVLQLEKYKKSLTSFKQLLSKVHEELARIEKLYPGIKLCVGEQLKYLDKLLHAEDYQVVWKTIMNIYRNIVNQLKPDAARNVIRETRENHSWKQVDVLNYLKNFYRDQKETRNLVIHRLEENDLKRFIEREEEQTKSKPPWIGDVVEELIGESVELKEWVERPGSEKGQLLGFIRENDFSEEEALGKFANKFKGLMEEDKEKTLNLFETILNEESIDPLAREKIIEKYADTDDPAFQALYNMHLLADSAESSEEKKAWLAEYEKIAEEQNLPPVVKESIERKRNFIEKDENKSDKTKFLIKELDNSDDKIVFIEGLSGNKDAPDELRSAARKFNIAINNDQFDEAFMAITSSSNNPATKIVFLKELKQIAESKGWIKDDPEEKVSAKRKTKIENKINFYKSIINGRIDESRQIKEKKDEVISDIKAGKKIRKRNLVVKETESKKKEKKVKDEGEVETEDMSDEERIFIRSMNIIKAFNDNIDALDPAVNTLVYYNQGDFSNKLKSHINMLIKNKKRLINQSMEMLKTNNANLDLLKEIHKSPAKVQYLWRYAILKKTMAGKLEDAFKQFEANKEFMGEITRISRIINSNNKNDFLKTMILKEIKLVTNIMKEFTIKNIRNLKTKTFSRQDKDKLSLFRDLLRFTGEKGVAAEQTQTEHPAADIDQEQKPADNSVKGPDKKEMQTIKPQNKSQSTANNKDDFYIKKVKKELDDFVKLCKSERTRSLAAKNKNRNAVINDFFTDLASGDPDALNYAHNQKADVAALFSAIITYKLNVALPATRDALKAAFEKKIIQRSDLSI